MTPCLSWFGRETELAAAFGLPDGFRDPVLYCRGSARTDVRIRNRITAANYRRRKFYKADLQVHGDRDRRWMFPLPADEEEITEENTRVELQRGGGAGSPEEATHNAMHNT